MSNELITIRNIKHPGADGAPDEESSELEPEVIDFAYRMFDLARAGSMQLIDNVDAGLPVRLMDAAGNSLIMLAAYHGHAPLVSALAERGADVNTGNDRGQTPLAGAVFKGAADVVEILMRYGADPDAGSPSARASAEFFQRHEIGALLHR